VPIMGVLHAEDANGGNARPVEATLGSQRFRHLGGLEDQAVWVIQVQAELAVPIPSQLVAPAGAAVGWPKIAQALRRAQLLHPAHDQSSPPFSMKRLKLPPRRELLASLGVRNPISMSPRR